MHGIGLLWLLGKSFYAANFILYRVAAWSGTIYLYRKGRRQGKKAYYVFAALVYVISWGLLALCSSRFWHWLSYGWHGR